MTTYEYSVNPASPNDEKETVEADEYRIEQNERSGMYEHVFYRDGKIVLIIPHYLLCGSVKRIE